MSLGLVVSIGAATDATGDEIESSFEVPDGADSWEVVVTSTTLSDPTTTTVGPTFPLTTTTTSEPAPTSSTTSSTASSTTTSSTTTSTTLNETSITSIFPTSTCPDSPCTQSWSAKWNIALQDSSGSPVSGAAVTVKITPGNVGTSVEKTCSSGGTGVCVITISSIPNNRTTISLNVQTVNATPVWSGGSVTSSTATRPV